MKTHKHSLNNLLLNRINESDQFLSVLKTNKENLIDTKNILNNTSFKNFWKFLGSDKNEFNSLALKTRIKIYKELKKINTHSINSAWIYTLLLTTALSCFISLSLFKKFSNEIRNKRKFLYRYIVKIPFIIMIPTYILLKNFLLAYNIRQPLISLNEIFCEIHCDKENRNPTMCKMRVKLGNHEKFLNNKEEFDKMINTIKIQETDKQSIISKTSKGFFPNFYLMNYKFLMLKLNYQIFKDMISLRNYFNNINKCEVNFRISYFFKILLFHHFEINFEKICKNLFESENLNLNKNIHNKLTDDFKIKLRDINISKTETSSDILNNFLINLRSIHLGNENTKKTSLLINMFILDTMSNFLSDKENIRKFSLLVKIYEIKFHLNFLRKYEIRQILSDMIVFNKILYEDKEAEEFFNYLNTNLNKTKVKNKEKMEFRIPPEYFTIGQLNELKREEKFLYKSKVNNLMIHSFILPTVSLYGLLKYKEYI